MAEDSGNTRLDKLFKKLSGKVVERVSTFVAFLFLLYASGVMLGIFIVTQHPEYIYHAIAAPVILGLISYYNRDVAMVLFVLFFIFIIFIA